MKTYNNIKDFMRFVMNAEEEITIRKNQAINKQGIIMNMNKPIPKQLQRCIDCGDFDKAARRDSAQILSTGEDSVILLCRRQSNS